MLLSFLGGSAAEIIVLGGPGDAQNITDLGVVAPPRQKKTGKKVSPL
jgi:hypothetical protein